MKKKAKKWMQRAVKRPGALTKKAHAAGMSPMEFARKHKHSSGRTGRQARFALIASKASKRRSRRSSRR
ncbi:MAG: hypothetical protein KGL39_43990 [Patescibacteria group bacterium]|nr:hypothetical protein [Patescibacteria group bacterium]